MSANRIIKDDALFDAILQEFNANSSFSFDYSTLLKSGSDVTEAIRIFRSAWHDNILNKKKGIFLTDIIGTLLSNKTISKSSIFQFLDNLDMVDEPGLAILRIGLSHSEVMKLQRTMPDLSFDKIKKEWALAAELVSGSVFEKPSAFLKYARKLITADPIVLKILDSF